MKSRMEIVISNTLDGRNAWTWPCDMVGIPLSCMFQSRINNPYLPCMGLLRHVALKGAPPLAWCIWFVWLDMSTYHLHAHIMSLICHWSISGAQKGTPLAQCRWFFSWRHGIGRGQAIRWFCSCPSAPEVQTWGHLLECYAQPTCEHGCKRFIYRTCHVMIMSHHCYVFTRHTQVAGMQIMKGIKTLIDEKQPMVTDDTVTEQHLYPMTPWQTYDHAWHVGPNIFSWICRRLSQERALVNWERDANLRPVMGSLWLNSIIMH